MRRPNILFLMADEHRADCAGYAGDAIVRTPTLDWLADGGVVFDNCYTPSPICVPGRQCLASGQLPRTAGVERYGEDLPPGSMTFARRLAQYAYTTVCCGKLHHDGVDQMQGWTKRIGSNCQIGDRYLAGLDASAVAACGKPWGDGKWSDAKEIARAGIGRASGTHGCDTLALAGARQFIEDHWLDPFFDRPAGHRPVLLKVSFNRPHYPYLTDADLFKYYLNRVEPYLDEKIVAHPFLASRRVRPGIDATAHEIRRATAAYYGMIEEVDRDFGLVLEDLQQAGEDLDDWIIVYTSDHGEMLGQHQVWEKQKFFEGSARVPLVIRWPRRFQPQRVQANVNLCDLFATLCELAAVPLPAESDTVGGRGLDSRSLVPLLAGDESDWNDETVSQFGGTNLMIKRGALKYQYYDRPECAEQPEVLFDLDGEPDEARNLIDDPAYAEALVAFRHRRAELGFGPEADPQYRNAGYRSAR